MAIYSISRRIPEIAAVLIALIFGGVFFLGNIEREARRLAAHTLEVQSYLHDFEAEIVTAESGQRGFLMSGNQQYLDRYEVSLKELPVLSDKILQLVADNDQQSMKAKELIANANLRLERLAVTIAARRSGDEKKVQQIFATHPGQTVMAKVRANISEMIQAEQDLFNARSQSALTVAAQLRMLIFLGVALTVGAMTFWIVMSRQQQRDLATANASLSDALRKQQAVSEQVRQLQKMEAVGQLTGGIAHDFNNALAVIMSGIALGRRRTGPSAGDEMFAKAFEAAERAAALVKKLMAFSRQQALSPETIVINKLIADTAELVRRTLGEHVQLETVLAGGLWPTHADAAELSTVLLNLCVNARDAMPNGGKLTIETANCHLDERYQEVNDLVAGGQYVLLAVTDTGTGMTPEIQAKAFEPFFTTKEVGKGTGLGLSQVFGFVKQSGGHVKIYSEPQQGTTIKVYLPRTYGLQQRLPVRSPQPEVNVIAGSKTVLIVEDESQILDIASIGLREMGCTVLEANSPGVALDILRTSVPIDLLLTDVVMPEMSGKRLAELARELRPTMAILFMTGFTKNAIVHNGILDAGVELIAKPFTIDDLAKKVRKVIEKT